MNVAAAAPEEDDDVSCHRGGFYLVPRVDKDPPHA
jgi:hypothetical protein